MYTQPDDNNPGNRISPTPPFVWPDPRIVEGLATYEPPGPIDAVLADATGLMGVLSDPGRDGVEWMTRILREFKDIKCKLLLSVFPACRTTQRDLELLVVLQQALGDRAEFRLILHDRASDGQGHLLYILQRSNAEAVIAVGPTPVFDPERARDKQVNVIFQATATLNEGWRNWFDLAW